MVRNKNEGTWEGWPIKTQPREVFCIFQPLDKRDNTAAIKAHPHGEQHVFNG